MPPTISAIITGYNYARFLPLAIESVLGQTRVPDEIVVVDDGSTDDTYEVIRGYARGGVRYVHRENGGVSAARNTGLRETSGDLVAFLDGDDQWLPNKLALQVAHFEANPSVGIVTGSECQVYESGHAPYYLHRKPVGAASYYPSILIENSIGNSSLVLIKRECFEKVGHFDVNLPLGQDWDMWIRIARSFPVGVVDAVLILFNRHATSWTAGSEAGRYISNKQIARRYIRRLPSAWLRLRLLLAAQSMNLYYMAAARADGQAERHDVLLPALSAVILDPTYESLNKVGLLVRVAFGRSAFDALKRFVPKEPGRSRTLPNCGETDGGR